MIFRTLQIRLIFLLLLFFFVSINSWGKRGHITFINNTNTKVKLEASFRELSYKEIQYIPPLKSYSIQWIDGEKRLTSFSLRTANIYPVGIDEKVRTVNEGVYAVGNISSLSSEKNLWHFYGVIVRSSFPVSGGFEVMSVVLSGIRPYGSYVSSCDVGNYQLDPDMGTLSVKCSAFPCTKTKDCWYNAKLSGLGVLAQAIKQGVIPITANIVNLSSQTTSGAFIAGLEAMGKGENLPDGNYKTQSSMAYFDSKNKVLYGCCPVKSAYGEIKNRTPYWKNQSSLYVVSKLSLAKPASCPDIVCSPDGVLSCTKTS